MRWPGRFALVVSGILLFQFGWLIAIPAFGGIDEFDHAYRAASVARGHWSPPLRPLKGGGSGDLIPVPSALVRAAENRCSILRYTKFGNCHAVSHASRQGEVLVASTAARYNPIYPWLVGTPARAFSGSAALYIMRAMTTLLADLFLFATWALVRRSACRWQRVAVLTSATPVLLYATANAAPNGVQMCAGLLMWTAGTALFCPWDTQPTRRTLWLFCLAATAVLTVHSTGPVWAACILASLAAWPGTLRGFTSVWRLHRWHLVAAGTAVSLAGLADVLWSWSHSTNLDWGSDLTSRPLTAQTLFGAFPLWVFQTIGAIPFRNQYVPTVVFATSLVVFGFLVALGLRRASRRQRAVLFGICVTFFGVPTLLTILSYQSLGLAWQGRYALPFACGLPLLCGRILDETRPSVTIAALFETVGTLGFCLTQAVAIWAVVADQRRNWPPTHSLQAPSDLVLATLLAVAAAFVCLGMWRRPRQRHPHREQHLAIEGPAYS